MKIISLLILCLLPLKVFAAQNHHFFVVDGSGSMSGTPLQKGIDAMNKLAQKLFKNGDKISIVVASETCDKPRLITNFIDNTEEFEEKSASITVYGGDKIGAGFDYAQQIMLQNNYTGHIFMFGDGDGLDSCNGIETIAQFHKENNTLTPFTYLGLDWDEEEKENWNKALTSFGATSGAAKTFDYNKVIKKKIGIKQYFVKPEFVNQDGSSNNGTNYKERPWRCTKSDGLFWYTLNQKEQAMHFFMKQSNYYSFTKHSNNYIIDEFLQGLNSDKVCGKDDWRLPDYFELSRLTQLGSNKREQMFPYIKIWPHISSTGGSFTGYRKGVDLNNGGLYDYREDRPYAAIFVSGNIDKNLFEPSDQFLSRSAVLNSNKQSIEDKKNTQPIEKNIKKTITNPQKMYEKLGLCSDRNKALGLCREK